MLMSLWSISFYVNWGSTLNKISRILGFSSSDKENIEIKDLLIFE
jgi:hypothetical protein